MSRENKYNIEISFNHKGQNKTLLDSEVPYYGSLSYKDNIHISNSQIIINANRSSIVQIESIFYNHFSSLYNQIIKALLFYYATTRKFTPIENIKVTRIRSGKILDKKLLNTGNFNQVLDESFRLSHSINVDNLSQLFEQTTKGQSTLIAVSYLLVANNNNISESEKFEKLWKAFNKLYKEIGNHPKEFECLRRLRQFIVDNPDVPKLSSKKVSPLNTKKLINFIRWRGMLLDNFDTEEKTGAFREFVIRYTDKRIMEIILQTKYGYRETFLKNKGMFNDVDNHLQHHIGANTNSDNEIVTLLTGKYMYFVRNKTFHGEKIDPVFRLSANKEDKELSFLNSVLGPYIIDLINSNDIY